MIASMHRMPRPKDSPKLSPAPIAVLAMELRRFRENEATIRREYPWADRFVMGLPLAPWQRQLKWSKEQSQRFITSAWSGIPLGSYILADSELEPGDAIKYAYMANCVLDGQQRLFALEQYLEDKLAVEDAAGRLTLWSELDVAEQRWFGNRIFARGTTPLASEAYLRELYDIMNFGGVAHEASERAVPSLRQEG